MTLFDTPLVRTAPMEKFMEAAPELMGEDWYGLTKDILPGVVAKLLAEKDAGREFYPGSNYMFRAFKECPLDSLKVVFVGQDPYHQTGVADGLAFSCSRTGIEQPSLKLIYDEIQRTAYHYNYARTADLTRWANQGILLLNTALTVEAHKPGTHQTIWHNFTVQVLDQLNLIKKDIIYIFVGSKARVYMNHIGSDNIKHTVVHPAAAAHRGGKWDCEDIFNRINLGIKSLGKEQIIW